MSQQEKKDVQEPAYQDCLSCRLTGAAAFTGLGLHALNQGRMQGALKKVRPAGKPVVAGQTSLLIGVGECALRSIENGVLEWRGAYGQSFVDWGLDGCSYKSPAEETQRQDVTASRTLVQRQIEFLDPHPKRYDRAQAGRGHMRVRATVFGLKDASRFLWDPTWFRSGAENRQNAHFQCHGPTKHVTAIESPATGAEEDEGL